jgi:hypothetical protein
MDKMAANLQGPETAKTIDALVTPTLLVDSGRLERNVQRLADAAQHDCYSVINGESPDIEARWRRIRGW